MSDEPLRPNGRRSLLTDHQRGKRKVGLFLYRIQVCFETGEDAYRFNHRFLILGNFVNTKVAGMMGIFLAVKVGNVFSNLTDRFYFVVV